MLPRPATLIAELSYQCPLHCPYCSNPLDIGGERYRRELETEHWIRTFVQARRLGVLQLALTGGEPMLRRDLVELCAGARDAGLYSSLITAGTLFTRDRAQALKAAGLDHVQISIQSPDAEDNDRIAGNRSFEKKIAAARHAKELDFPLTINCVLHRQNLDRIEELLDLALDLGAQRLELANTQYYGWAVPNQDALMPSREQLRRAEEAVVRFRERIGPAVDVLWVLPDFYEELPKPCMGGWGRTAMVVAPNGDVMPCQAASTIPGLEFANVRDHPLEWIWSESDAFARFRGTDWMQEPCRTCPLGRQEVDWGGCRCQALRLAGDAAATDPVCRFSPHHDRVVAAREPAQTRAVRLSHDEAPRAGLTRQSPSARRTTGALRRDTGTVSRAARSMISDSSPLGPRSTARTHDRFTMNRRWTRMNSPPASSSSSLSMPCTAAWRRPSSVTSQTSLPSASAKLTSGRRSRTMRSPLTPTMRAGGISPGSGRSRSIGSPSSAPKTASVPIGWSARKTGRRVIRRGSVLSSVTICVEPTQSWSRRACLMA